MKNDSDGDHIIAMAVGVHNERGEFIDNIAKNMGIITDMSEKTKESFKIIEQAHNRSMAINSVIYSKIADIASTTKDDLKNVEIRNGVARYSKKYLEKLQKEREEAYKENTVFGSLYSTNVSNISLAKQSELYDKISIYRVKIDTIDNLIEQSNEAQSTPPPSTSSINTPPRDNVLAQKNNRFFSVKERLTNAFGVLGGVLYLAINIIISILPFVMIGGGFWFSFLLISLNTIVPYASIVFWIWGLICAIQGVQDIWAIIYYILFVVIWLPFYINLILALISDLKNK
jgi:hypothetical protein